MITSGRVPGSSAGLQGEGPLPPDHQVPSGVLEFRRRRMERARGGRGEGEEEEEEDHLVVVEPVGVLA